LNLNSLNIVIDCDSGGSPGGWWPESHLEGNRYFGGSEEQAQYTAKYLVKLGHRVTFRNDCRDHAGVYDGVTYINYQDGPAPDCDVYCSQRNKNLVRERHAPLQVLLCHDIPISDHMFTHEEIENGALKNVDLIILLNEHHRKLYIEHGVPASKIRVCPIMVPTFDINVERIPGRCVYCSCPTRGLERLMNYWSEIKRRAPHATLQICWRFSIAHDRMCDVDRPWFEKWENGNEELGVLPLKNCSHDELAIELSKAELLTYPSTFDAEISPASTIKSQIFGAVPLVVNCGGMHNTVEYGHNADYNDYPIAVSNALNDPDWQQKNRELMMPAIKDKYDPDRVIHIWENIIKQAIDRNAHNNGVNGPVKISTEYPIAYESQDYQNPLGALWNTGNPELVQRLLSFDIESHLDLGCAGGKFVRQMLGEGVLSIGIEGADYPITNGNSEWMGKYSDHFFTADITKPFTLTYDKFDVVTSFEVLEHIHEDDLTMMFWNISTHTHEDSICVFTASNDSSWSNGVDLHVTKWNYDQWINKFKQFGWKPSDKQSQFEESDWGGWIGPSTMHFVLERTK